MVWAGGVIALGVALLVLSGGALADAASDDPEPIEDWHDLDEVRDDLDGEYVLTADLDEDTAGYDDVVGDGDGFKPIGSLEGDIDSTFRGTVDGDGHTIADLHIDREDESTVGLFGVLTGTVENMTIENATVTGNLDTGAVAGDLQGGTVADVSVSGSVTADQQVGGIVGTTNTTGTLAESSMSGSVTADDQQAGGIVGINRGMVANTESTAEISADNLAGGIAGDTTGTVVGAAATGDVDGNSEVGGVAGGNLDTITNAYSTGNVTAESGLAGGVVAQNGLDRGSSASHGTIDQVYAAGTVSGGDEMGGLVGEQQTNESEVRNSYWDIETTDQDEAIGDDVGSTVAVDGLETDEMTGDDADEELTAFDFEDDWQTEPDDYPTLQSVEHDDDGDDPAFFAVAIDEGASDLEADDGETVTVAVDVTNTGGEEGDTTLGVGTESEEAVNQTLTLEADENETVSVEVPVTADDDEVGAVAFDDDDDPYDFDTAPIDVADDGPFFAVEIDDDESDLEVADGENITVTADIENTGPEAGSGEVSVAVGSFENERENVTLDSGANETYVFDIPVTSDDDGSDVVVRTFDDDGDEQDDDQRTVSVEDTGPFFEIDVDEDASDLEVSDDEDVTIVADINNTGAEDGSGEVRATSNITTETEDLSLDSGENTTVELEVPVDATDDEIVVETRDDDGVDQDEELVSVSVDGLPYFAVEIDDESSDLLAVEGDTLSIVATIENTGTLDDTQEITLSDFAGDTAAETELAVESGDTETVALDLETEVSEAGTHTVTVASANETTTENVTLLDSERLEWRFDTDEIVDSSPTVVDGIAYVGSHDERVYAIDVETGDEVWNRSTDDVVRSSPQVVDETVYVGSFDGDVYALNASTGEEVWTVETGDEVLSSPTVDTDTVYVGSRDNHVYAIDRETGDEQWRFETDGVVDSSPTVKNGIVYIGDRESVSSLNYGRVYAIDAATGNEIWHEEFNNYVWSSPQVVDDTVYVGSDDETLYALDAYTGDREWEYDEPDGHVTGTPAIAEDMLFVGSHDDTVHAVDPETGEQEWVSDVPEEYIFSSATVVDDIVYVGSMDGSVYGFDADSGSVVWEYTTGAGVWSSPTVVDGTLFVGSDDGGFYALDAAGDGTSEDVRVDHGTLGHHDSWTGAEDEPTLGGTVTDNETGDELANVTVTVSDDDIEETRWSDDDGEYAAYAEADTVTVTFEHDAYETKTLEDVDIAGDTAVENVSLEPESVPFTINLTDIDPAVVAGEELTATVEIENEGDEQAEQEVTFAVDDELEDETLVDLEPGESEALELTWETDVDDDLDEYDVSIGTESHTLSTSVALIEAGEAYYNVSVATVDAGTASDGVNVTTLVENVGDGEGEQNITLFVEEEGQALGTLDENTLEPVAVYENLTLEAGEEEMVDLFWETDETDVGEQTLSVGSADTETSFPATVGVSEAASFDVTLEEFDPAVTPGETLTANATVENIGDEEGTQDISLRSEDDSQLDSEELTLESGESETVELDWETDEDDEGTTTLAVRSENDSVETTVAVLVGEVHYDDVTVSEDDVPLGSSVIVSATVANDEDAVESTYEAPLVVGNEVVDTLEGTVDAGDEETVTFDVAIDQLGTVAVGVGDAEPTPVSITKAWSQYGLGDGNLGHSSELSVSQTAVGEDWSASIDARLTDPVVAGDVAYVGDDEGTVHAFDTETGDELWSHTTANAITATPIVNDGVLYVGTEDGVLALEADGEGDGDELWQTSTASAVGGLGLADDVLYVGTGDDDEGTVYALEADADGDGEERWSLEVDGEVTAAPAVVGETLYVGTDSSDGGTLYALESGTENETMSDDERIHWSVETADGIAAAPVHADGTLYVATAGEDGTVYALAGNGTERWSVDADAPVLGSPAVANETVYVGSDDGMVHALATADGSLEWDTHTSASGIESSPVVAEETVIVGTADTVKDPHMMAFNAQTGQQRWHQSFDGHVNASPAVLEGQVYAGVDDVGLAALGEQIDESTVQVEDVTVNETDATEDDEVNVTVTVTNTGPDPESVEIQGECQIEDVLVDCLSWEVDVSPGETVRVSSPTTLSQRGVWFIIVDSNPTQVTSTPPGTINGTVTDSQTGEVVPNTTVKVRSGNKEQYVTREEVVTDEDGYYEINVSSGTYNVYFEHEKYETKWNVSNYVPPGETKTVDAELDELVWVSGHVTLPDGEPAENHTASLDDLEADNISEIFDHDVTNETGAFELGVPKNDTYALVATEQNFPDRDVQYFPRNTIADLYANQSVDLEDADPGDEVDVGEVGVPEGYNVNITVVDAAGEGVFGADVMWRHNNTEKDTFGEFHWINTDPEGQPGVTFDDPGVELPAGENDLQITPPWGEPINKTVELGPDKDLEVEPEPRHGNESDFEIDELTVDDPAFAGETVTANATIKNVGTVSDTQNVSLGFEETDVETEEELSLQTGANDTIELEWETELEDTGEYILSTSTDNDSKEELVEIVPADQPFFDVEFGRASLVEEGENVTVHAWAENLGDETGVQDVNMSIEDEAVDVEPQLSLGPDARTLLTFTWETEIGDAGIHNVTVASEDRERNDTLEVLGPQEPLFSVDITETNDPVEDGAEIVVDASVVNLGQESDTQSITLTTADGTVLDNETVTLDASAVRSPEHLTFTWDDAPPGEHELTVESDDDNATTNVTVADDEDEDAGDLATFDVEPADDPITQGEPLGLEFTNATDENGTPIEDNASLQVGQPGFDPVDSDIAFEDGNATVELLNETATTEVDPGEYTETVASAADSAVNATYNVTIVAEDEPFFAVDIDENASELDVDVNDTVTVTSSIENVGGDQSTQSVTLTDDADTDAHLDTTNVTLEPDESATVNLTWTTETGDDGEPTLAVATDNASATTTATVGDVSDGTTVTECTTIDEPGTYTLEENLTTAQSGGVDCIEITADDVHFDGAGHTIAGGQSIESTGGNNAISVTGADNVSVENVVTTGWDALGNGVYLEDTTNSSLTEVTAENNTFGVRTANVTGFSFAELRAESNDRAGVQVYDSSEGALRDVQALGNDNVTGSDFAGIYVREDGQTMATTEDIHLENVTAAESPTSDGISVTDGVSNATIENATVLENEGTGIRIDSDDVTVTNSTASDNGWAVATGENVSTTVENLALETAPNLSADAESVRLREAPDPPANPAGAAVNRSFAAEGVADGTPVLNVTVDYNKSALPADVEPETVELWRFDTDDDEWTTVVNSTVDTNRSIVAATLTDFSTFGVFGSVDSDDDDAGTSPGTGGGPAGTDPSDPDPSTDAASFTVDTTAAEPTVVDDETIQATATVENVGNEAGEHTVDLEIDGERVATETVSLDGGETETVTFEHSLEDTGEVEIGIDGEPVDTVTLESDAATDDDPSAADEPPVDDSVPGFGIVVAVAALLLATTTIAARRR